MMLSRLIAPQVEDALRRQGSGGADRAAPGPARRRWPCRSGAARDALYLDLQDSADRARLAAPVLFLDNVENCLVILDDIHRMPELFQALRGVIDRGRRQGRGTGRFLILGSASIDLLRQIG